jgi:hypothetical protein
MALYLGSGTFLRPFSMKEENCVSCVQDSNNSSVFSIPFAECVSAFFR